MKRQTLALIKQKPSDKRAILSVGVVFAIANSAISLPVNAQGSQDSFLPPEVIPAGQAIQYGSANTINNALTASNQTPGIAAQGINAQAMQTPQEARQALYNSLMGTNTYPQFNGQTFNQPNNSAGNINTNQSFNPSQAYNEGSPQTLNNQIQPTANMQMAQNNMPNNPAPTQSQTLSGSAVTQTTAQKGPGGFVKTAGLTAGVGMSAVGLAGMRSPGGIYSAGLLGASLLNYGLRSGLKF